MDMSEVVLRALDIEEDLTLWLVDLPPAFQFTTIPVDPGTIGVYENNYHVYENLWAASIWNTYRTTLLMVHAMILEWLAPYALSANTVDTISNPALQYQKSTSAVDFLAREIAASLPFNLGFNSKDDRYCSQPRGPPVPAAGGLFSLWSLYVLGMTDYVSHDIVTWAIDRLAMIGNVMGIQTAFMLIWVIKRKHRMHVT